MPRPKADSARPHRRPKNRSPLFEAVRACDAGAVRRLLADGANPRLAERGETPLHAAARRGPLAVVEALIVGGALDWQADDSGRTALAVARRGRPRERAAIVALLDRRWIADRSFREAVTAIHAGDVAGLERLLDAEPRLLRERNVGPEAYRLSPRPGYFVDPMLFWFVANNPALVERMPDNIVDVARVMIERGVDATDLDYALELTMTGRVAREQNVQIPLMRALLGAGARATSHSIAMAGAHREWSALRALLEMAEPMTVGIAASLGDGDALSDLLPAASAEDVQIAFGLAVINGHSDAARSALEGGADVDAFLPVHGHMTALHQAAQVDDVALIELLLANGARTDRRDTLWDGTPLDWATYFKCPAARQLLTGAR